MSSRRRVETVILALLVAGAVVFVLLLSGVGSGLISKPVNYSPTPSSVPNPPAGVPRPSP
jgi:hypothetical protein